MPGENLCDWSTTAASNANADSSIYWAEGQARASVNDSARSMMAAHAKDRNLKNGSITTGGTANAQTFTSGVTYTAVPTGLRVLLKIGFTNTGTTTLSMDGITAVAVKDQSGNDLSAGALVLGQYAEFLYNGTNWILLEGNETLAVVPQSGRLAYVSATALSFLPFNGDRIKINGIVYAIPSAGITGLANTGVFVNGVAAQNLAASTCYYVYAFNNSAVITADFSTTGHATSATVGNVGVEIKNGDDSRTLIGMVQTIAASGQFQSNAANRNVVSWFNRRNLSATGANLGGTGTGSTTPIEMSAGARATFVTWGEEHCAVGVSGYAKDNTGGFSTQSNIGLDGTTAIIGTTVAFSSQANASHGHGNFGAVGIGEGAHFITPLGWVDGGLGIFSTQCSVLIRG